jgi:hypothetical protein
LQSWWAQRRNWAPPSELRPSGERF